MASNFSLRVEWSLASFFDSNLLMDGTKRRCTQQDLMFLSHGMTDFFRHAKGMMRKEGLDETALRELFKDLRGIILLDTLGNTSQLRKEVEQLETGLEILETKYVGCENVKNVIQEAIERNKKATRKHQNIKQQSSI